MISQQTLPKKQPFKAASGRLLYYEYQEGVGTPLVFLNGLDDSMEIWKKTVRGLSQPNPRLFVDLSGQGEALRQEMKETPQANYQIPVEVQGQALVELLQSLKIQKRILVGNSYGGGIALWLSSQAPEQTEKLILVNPFILRLDLSFPWARLLAFQYKMARQLTPQAFHSPFDLMEKSYEKFIHNFMHFRFKHRIGDEKLRQVSVELSKAVMEFNSFEILKDLPDHSVYLIFSELDTLVPRSLYHEFWMRLPRDKKRNCFQLKGGDHLILEQAPKFVCTHLDEILSGSLMPNEKIEMAADLP